MPRNRLVVLVVEDEPLVRALAVDALEDEGFEVIEASTGDYVPARGAQKGARPRRGCGAHRR